MLQHNYWMPVYILWPLGQYFHSNLCSVPAPRSGLWSPADSWANRKFSTHWIHEHDFSSLTLSWGETSSLSHLHFLAQVLSLVRDRWQSVIDHCWCGAASWALLSSPGAGHSLGVTAHAFLKALSSLQVVVIVKTISDVTLCGLIVA